jgi:hypothetical protein
VFPECPDCCCIQIVPWLPGVLPLRTIAPAYQVLLTTLVVFASFQNPADLVHVMANFAQGVCDWAVRVFEAASRFPELQQRGVENRMYVAQPRKINFVRQWATPGHNSSWSQELCWLDTKTFVPNLQLKVLSFFVSKSLLVTVCHSDLCVIFMSNGKNSCCVCDGLDS